MNKKESLIKKIKNIEYNIRIFRILLEEDRMHGDVPNYCMMKVKLQAEFILQEINQQQHRGADSLLEGLSAVNKEHKRITAMKSQLLLDDPFTIHIDEDL
jgi:hypothetical protein